MPIRINLLAEAQAAEELRRRDPVKRAIWIASLLVALMLVWSSSLQVMAMKARGSLNQIQAKVDSQKDEYQTVLANQKKSLDVDQKLKALQRLSTDRFLNGNLLQALQKTTVENVQLMRLKVDQTYFYVDAIKPRTNSSRVIPGKPATSTEKIVITLDAKDSSHNPGDQVNKYREKLAGYSYFENILGKTNELRLTRYVPQSLPGTPPSVLFSLEARLPEKTR